MTNSEQARMNVPHLIKLGTIQDESGVLTFGEFPEHINFSPKRFYYIYKTKPGTMRDIMHIKS